MTQSASSVSVSLGASAPASQAPAIPGWEHRSSGKVRDIYSPTAEGPWAGQDVFLVVASDRISAYDHILSTPIPDKGRVLTALSAWWFEQLADVVPGHLVSLDVPAQVSGRAMICRRLEMYPVECVARGYLTGSGLAEYRESRSVCGVPLPEGLTEASRLPEPIFTPAAKAELGEHDENVTFARVTQMVGEAAATALRETTLALYTRAARPSPQAASPPSAVQATGCVVARGRAPTCLAPLVTRRILRVLRVPRHRRRAVARVRLRRPGQAGPL